MPGTSPANVIRDARRLGMGSERVECLLAACGQRFDAHGDAAVGLDDARGGHQLKRNHIDQHRGESQGAGQHDDAENKSPAEFVHDHRDSIRS
jgi:hypothetical protein